MAQEAENEAAHALRNVMVLKTHYDMVGFIKQFRYKSLPSPRRHVLLFDERSEGDDNLVDSDPWLLQDMMTGLDKKPTVAGHSSPESPRSS